jgi:D-cysteine desulfhydrase family pyridoxal phosphate-dependent enzyme
MEDKRIELVPAPTPLEPADRLAAAIGLPAGTLWVKREDTIGLGGGGNKVRKLEFLCAEALAGGCDTLVTGGGPQSNHVRLTAAAAARLGLACVAVLASEQPVRLEGNLLLDRVFGAEIVWAGDLAYYQLEQAIVDEVARQAGRGRQPYAIPLGGASTVGTLGYVRAAQELVAQDPDFDLVVTAAGTGGTHAGLAAGLGDLDRVLGVDAGTRPDLDDWVPSAAAAAAQLAGLPAPGGTCHLDHSRFGAGYGDPTDDCRRALGLAARTEGLVLDPVYSGKALAGLIAAVEDGRVRPGTKVVFLATGGAPALFTSRYDRWLLGE